MTILWIAGTAISPALAPHPEVYDSPDNRGDDTVVSLGRGTWDTGWFQAEIFRFLLTAAHIIWLSERRRNPEFPPTYFRGIWASFWWSAVTVTVTTVGYVDKTPRGTAGRVFALTWMFSGFFILAYFTASVTAR